MAFEQSQTTVDKGKINFIFSIYGYLIILIEMVIFYAASLVEVAGITVPAIELKSSIIFMFVMLIYPISSFIRYKIGRKMETRYINLKKQIIIGFIAAIAVALQLILINGYTGLESLWCIFPIVGILNWPVGLMIYKKLYKNSKAV